jgi:hypothetical protein
MCASGAEVNDQAREVAAKIVEVERAFVIVARAVAAAIAPS